MKYTFHNKQISAVVSVMPPTEVDFKDELHNYSFSASQNLRLAKIMGFNKRRMSQLNETISDYAVVGIQKLIDSGALNIDEVGAIVVVTTTPDHVVPPVSSIIQGKFAFSQETICLDITQGCSGYIVGVMQSFLLLEILKDKKVLLVNGDFLTHKISTRDRGSRPIAGDAVGVSIIENTEEHRDIYFSLKNDGANAFAVYIPAGGTRLPSSEETAVEMPDDYGNFRSQNHLMMNGDLVFNFILNEAPTMMEELLEYAGMRKEGIDFFMCHQSSRFTLEKLADRLEVPREKLPNNVIETFGNSSSASVPVAITHNLSSMITTSEQKKIMLVGFGIGLTWGAIILDMGNLKYCGMIDYPNNQKNEIKLY
jgi:3-oxoacyl-[acyl-carrier-protein] synthase-3